MCEQPKAPKNAKSRLRDSVEFNKHIILYHLHFAGLYWAIEQLNGQGTFLMLTYPLVLKFRHDSHKRSEKNEMRDVSYPLANIQ